MARIDFDLQKYDGEFKKAGMERLEKAANVLRDDARSRVKVYAGKLHGPYKRGKYAGQIWTARDTDNMQKTIRVVRKKGFENVVSMDIGSGTLWTEGTDVRVYAGNYKTWYATQMEYGRGAWKGGARPFMRPAMAEFEGKVRSIIEGG